MLKYENVLQVLELTKDTLVIRLTSTQVDSYNHTRVLSDGSLNVTYIGYGVFGVRTAFYNGLSDKESQRLFTCASDKIKKIIEKYSNKNDSKRIAEFLNR